MHSHSLPWWLAVVLLLSGCSLLTDFDDEGRPCSDAGVCAEGYVCSKGVCLSSPDGGTDGGPGRRSLCEDPAGCPEAPEAR